MSIKKGRCSNVWTAPLFFLDSVWKKVQRSRESNRPRVSRYRFKRLKTKARIIMQKTIQSLTTVLGRFMIATIFLLSAVGNNIPKFQDVAGYMGSKGVPQPQLMLAGAIVFLIAGSLSMIVGYHARFGAALLAIFLVLATYYFHDFWNLQGQESQMEMIQFMKNLSMLGTMVFIIANGSGPMSLDATRKAKDNLANV